MKKYFKLLFIVALMMSFFVGQPSKVLAVPFVNIDFYYQRIEGVYDSNQDIDVDESKGESLVVSSSDKNYTYKVTRRRVTSETELIYAMGKSSEDELDYGQKCLLESFRAATSPEMKANAKTSYHTKLEINLTDTSYVGKDIPDELKDRDGKGLKTGPYTSSVKGLTPNIQDDFWPCSSNTGKKVNMPWEKCYINLCDCCSKYYDPDDPIDVAGNRSTPSGIDDAYSTVFHEYAHFMDNTKRGSDTYGYGLDKTHYIDEVTSERMAFIEGWAEYNEMILTDEQVSEDGSTRQEIINICTDKTKKLGIESTTNEGDYSSKVEIGNASCATLLKSEAFDAYLLFRLSQEIGEDRINKVFVDTRWNNERNITDIVKRLVLLYPHKADTICSVVDEVYFGKVFEDDDGNFSTDNFYKIVGETEETKIYAEKREKGEDTTPNDDDKVTSLDEALQYIKVKSDDLYNELEEKQKAREEKRKEREEKIKSKFTEIVNTVKDKVIELAENDKAKREQVKNKFNEFFDNIKKKFSSATSGNTWFDRLLDKFKKLFGISSTEETEENDNEPVDGIVIENNPDEEIDVSNEEITVEGSSSNPFAEED